MSAYKGWLEFYAINSGSSAPRVSEVKATPVTYYYNKSHVTHSLNANVTWNANSSSIGSSSGNLNISWIDKDGRSYMFSGTLTNTQVKAGALRVWICSYYTDIYTSESSFSDGVGYYGSASASGTTCTASISF